jgi:hypothetical protein
MGKARPGSKGIRPGITGPAAGRKSVRSSARLAIAQIVLLPFVTATWAQSWSTAQRLNDPGENNGAIKEPVVCGAASGGFHAAYRYHIERGPVLMQYRRFQGGALGPVKTLHSTTIFGGGICEAGNGDIHVVWENWDGSTDIGWTKSSDGGLTWTVPVEITSFGTVGKIPHIVPFGAANSSEVVMTCGKATVKEMWFNRYNGSSWSGAAYTGVDYESEYQIFGLARSLQDGTAYMSVDRSNTYVAYTRYNGVSWSGLNDVHQTGFFARQALAVNPLGQVMVGWEKDAHYYAKLFTPGVG